MGSGSGWVQVQWQVIGNLRPADVYHGRGAQILKAREEIKKETIRQRRLQHQSAAAKAQAET